MSVVVVLDTETSGLPSSPYAQPVSIGAAIYDTSTGMEVDTFYTLVRPTLIHTKEYWAAARIHGIMLADLEQDGLNNEDACIEFRDWWIGHGVKRPMLHAFNADFDSLMLQRMGFDPKGYWGPCIMKHAAQAMGRTSGKVALNAAAKHFGNQRRSDACLHNALEDARLAAAVGFASGLFG